MSSIEPYVGSHQEYSGEEVFGGFIVACGNAAELLEFSEEVLDQVSRLQVFIIGARRFSVGFWRDDDLFSSLLERFYDSFIGIKGFISKDSFGCDAR